ncbi:hypothetical protein ATANTOWER_013392, partial [Ataeniobius toweri]|nr:hypothetical protein [Ataeniobius toweri]
EQQRYQGGRRAGGTWHDEKDTPALKHMHIWIGLYFAPSILPSTLINFPVPAEEMHPHSMMLPPPCFQGVDVPSCTIFSM